MSPSAHIQTRSGRKTSFTEHIPQTGTHWMQLGPWQPRMKHTLKPAWVIVIMPQSVLKAGRHPRGEASNGHFDTQKQNGSEIYKTQKTNGDVPFLFVERWQQTVVQWRRVTVRLAYSYIQIPPKNKSGYGLKLSVDRRHRDLVEHSHPAMVCRLYWAQMGKKTTTTSEQRSAWITAITLSLSFLGC